MEQEMPFRSEVILAGVGGRGILLAGLLLAQAGMRKYEHVTWSPSYAVAMRGGPCECTVIMSEEEIPSPILSETEAVIAMDAGRAKPFEDRIKSGGIIIVEKAGLDQTVQAVGRIERKDIQILIVPGMETAHALGEAQAGNFVLLGAYLGKTGLLPIQMIEEELEKRMTGDRKQALRDVNKAALREGAKFMASLEQ